MMTMPNSRGSCRSSRNSLRTRCRTRLIGPSPHSRLRRSDASDRTIAANTTSAASSCQNTVDADALQHDPAKRDQEVARRHHVGDGLQHRRHAGDREDEPREHQRRQIRGQQRELKRHLLRLGERRDQHAERQRADEEERDREEQHHPRSAHRQIEEQHRERRRCPSPTRARRTKYGTVLPTTYANGPTGDIRTCSIVPTSFSRTIESAVETTAVSIAMYAISPGTRNSVLRSSGLYQTRVSAVRSGAAARDRRAPAPRSARTARPRARRRSPSRSSPCSRCRR